MGAFGGPPTRDNAAPSTMPMGGEGMGQLLGAPSQGQPSVDMQQHLESATRKFRDLLGEVNSLASSFPAAAQELRAAHEALQSAVLKVTQEITKQQPQPPAGRMAV